MISCLPVLPESPRPHGAHAAAARRRYLIPIASAAALAIAWLAISDSGPARFVRAQAKDAAGGRLAGLPEAEARLRAAAAEAKVRFPLEKVTLRVEKAGRRLTLLSDGKPLRRYKVGLGPAPAGHKQREGDGRTPEGDYTICTRNEKSRFHLFLGISYPAPRDAERALAAGEIDAATAARIRAVRPPAAPPWNTPLGGEVGIHGHGASRDWTLGCVALEDEDVDELWVACPLGTPLVILP